MGYQPLTYRTDGGDKIVVASGGTIDIESGGAFKIGGTTVTASAAELNALGGSATDFDCGASGTAGSLDIFPGTAANGKLIHTCTNNGGARNLTLTNVAQTSGSGTIKYPDMAGGTGRFVVTNADQACTIVTGAADRTVTLGGSLTTTGDVSTGAVTLAGALTTAAAVTFSGAFACEIAVPDASTWTLPAGGGTLATTTGAETGTTSSTFVVDSDSSTGKFTLSTNTAGTNHTVTLKAPVTTQTVTLTLPDAATDTLCAIAATQTLAAKTLTAPVINGATTAAAANNFALHTSTGTFTTPTGIFTHYGNVTNNGNITFDFSSSSGAFTTSAGTNTLSGHTTTASGKNLTVAGSGTFTTGTGAVTIKGATTFDAGLDIAFSGAGDGTLNMGNQTGAFTTSTGTNTLSGNVSASGTVTLATTKGLYFGSAAAGTATPITAYSLTANKGALILAVTDAATDHATTLTNAALNGAAATITLPNATSTLSGLGLAETFSGVKTFTVAPLVTLDDTTDGVVNCVTLTHSSSDNNATAGDGAGISFQLENATGTSTVEEWASIDVVSTTITNGSEDGDLVVSAMLAGTVTEALRLDASDQSLSLGRSATDANGVYRLRVFPVTGSRGSLVLSATANTDDHSLILTNAAVTTSDKTVTIPAETCTLSGLGLAETFSGVKTFSAAPVVAIDDASNTAVTDVLTLTHTTSGAPGAGIGAGISVIVENDSDATTQVASVDFVTTSDGTKVSLDTDVLFSTMLGGTVTEALRINAGAQEVVIGRDATDANGMHGLRIWPLTASKGSILIQPADNTGDDTVTLTNTNTGGDITVTLPATTCTLVGKDTTDDLTNKSFTGSTNTGVVVSKTVTFTENATNTTHTGTVPIPAGAMIHSIKIVNTVLWGATSATLIVGDDDDDNGFFDAVDCKATDLLVGEVLDTADDGCWGGKEGVYLTSAGRRGGVDTGNSGPYYAASNNIIAVMTVGTPAVTTGRTFMTVTYSVGEVIAAVATGP